MPYAAPRRCRCGQLQPCPTHAKAWARPSRNTTDLTRRDRERFRRAVLAREPACRVCGRTDQLEADHVIEVADGGSATDPANGQTLCKDHHDEKTRAVAQARKARKTPPAN